VCFTEFEGLRSGLVAMNGCGIVSLDWQSSAEGETILQHFYDPQTTGRKVLGMFIHDSKFL
jgi:hypothetical protein